VALPAETLELAKESRRMKRWRGATLVSRQLRRRRRRRRRNRKKNNLNERKTD
jgi:hypothetical protein